MKKKFSLLCSGVAICLTIALFIFGVYAASSATFSMTNNIIFDATKLVHAEIQASVRHRDGTAQQTFVSDNTNIENPVFEDWRPDGNASTVDVIDPLFFPSSTTDDLVEGEMVFKFIIRNQSHVPFIVSIDANYTSTTPFNGFFGKSQSGGIVYTKLYDVQDPGYEPEAQKICLQILGNSVNNVYYKLVVLDLQKTFNRVENNFALKFAPVVV